MQSVGFRNGNFVCELRCPKANTGTERWKSRDWSGLYPALPARSRKRRVLNGNDQIKQGKFKNRFFSGIIAEAQTHTVLRDGLFCGGAAMLFFPSSPDARHFRPPRNVGRDL